LKAVALVLKYSVVKDPIVVMIESLNAIDRNATMVEKSSENTLIRNDWNIYRERRRKREYSLTSMTSLWNKKLSLTF
jgi:hypothetical protein